MSFAGTDSCSICSCLCTARFPMTEFPPSSQVFSSLSLFMQLPVLFIIGFETFSSSDGTFFSLPIANSNRDEGPEQTERPRCSPTNPFRLSEPSTDFDSQNLQLLTSWNGKEKKKSLVIFDHSQSVFKMYHCRFSVFTHKENTNKMSVFKNSSGIEDKSLTYPSLFNSGPQKVDHILSFNST